MTIPTLIANTRATELQTAFKKTYSELNQASRLFLNENEEDISTWTARNGMSAFISEFPKYIKGITKTSDWIWSDVETNSDGTKNYNYPYDIYCMNGNQCKLECDASGFRMDISGKMYLFDDSPKKGFNGPRICVDINGTKKPNIIGIDIFSFIFTTDGQVIPEGQEHPDNDYDTVYYGGGTLTGSTYCRANSSIHQRALTCAYYALNDKSPKGDGHRYWKDFVAKKEYK